MTDRLLTFIHISDTHLHTDPTYTGQFTDVVSRPGVDAMIRQINALPFDIDFILHTGDVMTDPLTSDEYALARDVLGQLRWPVYYLSGNHDRAQAIQQVLMNRPPALITPALNYEFDVNGVQVVCLDSSIPDPTTHHGYISPEQLAWADQRFAANDDRPLVVGVHHHPLPLNVPWLDKIVMTNGTDLHRILVKARHRLRGVFYGHIHENVVTVRDGVNYYSALSGWFQTRTWHNQQMAQNEPMHNPGFNVVTLTKQDTFVRFYRVKL
ncbi:MAG: hypothetical protein CL610_27585 [Anaerolineaceae bacterium]|nr:hypothetical protein [Anaerolineaceae bacterium]